MVGKIRSAVARNPSEHRRAVRELVDFRTKAALRGIMHEMRVINISSLGLMARIEADVRKNDRLIIELPHLRTAEAIVRWVEDGRVGTEFMTPISDADYPLMLLSIPKRQTAW